MHLLTSVRVKCNNHYSTSMFEIIYPSPYRYHCTKLRPHCIYGFIRLTEESNRCPNCDARSNTPAPNFIEQGRNCFTVLRSGKQISSADLNWVTNRFVHVSFSVGGNWRVVNDFTWALKCVDPTESYLRFWDFIENTPIRLSDMVPFAFWNSTAVGFVLSFLFLPNDRTPYIFYICT